jgi:hypothetical protein
MTVGCNRFTPMKWDRIEYLLRVHSRMVDGIAGRVKWARPEYHYFDMYAGPGFYTTQLNCLYGDSGSPVIAAGILRNQPHRLYLNDKDKRCVLSLATSIAEANAHAQITCLDACDFARRICNADFRKQEFNGSGKKPMGLLMVDPNGAPCWEAVHKIAHCPQYDRLDVLINVNATSAKWNLVVHADKGHKRLTEQLRRLRKKYLYLWSPHKSNPWQFSLVFATNWGEFPEFRKSHFYRSDTPDGKELLYRLAYTEAERKGAYK